MKIGWCINILFSINVAITLSAQSSLPTDAVPGKCYAKCLIQEPSFDTLYDEMLIPLDLSNKSKGMKWKGIIISVQDSFLFRYSSPVEFSVTELLSDKVIERFIAYYTSRKTCPECTKVIIEHYKVKSACTDWQEVVCELKVTKSLIYNLQLSLQKMGYPLSSITSVLDKETRTALFNFQKDHNLPIGALNIRTLNALDINY